MDEYHPANVFSSIDQQGRYAYANQPQIATWNLARFAETLLPLIDEDQQKAIDQAQDVLKCFSTRFEAEYSRGARMRAVNPAFIPRNHRIEAMIEEAVERAPFEELLLVLAKPFEDQASFRRYMDPPQAHERVCQTFCGT
jgi:uncharacterized protein YdiU (UPF0061 family)